MDYLPNELILVIGSFLTDRHGLLRQVCRRFSHLFGKKTSDTILGESILLYNMYKQNTEQSYVFLSTRLGRFDDVFEDIDAGCTYDYVGPTSFHIGKYGMCDAIDRFTQSQIDYGIVLMGAFEYNMFALIEKIFTFEYACEPRYEKNSYYKNRIINICMSKVDQFNNPDTSALTILLDHRRSWVDDYIDHHDVRQCMITYSQPHVQLLFDYRVLAFEHTIPLERVFAEVAGTGCEQKMVNLIIANANVVDSTGATVTTGKHMP